MKNKFHLILLLSLLSLLTFSFTVQAKMVSVKGDSVNLRKGPGSNYGVKWVYGYGFPLKILNTKGDWYSVEDFEKEKGWIHKSYVQYAPQVIVKVNRGRDKKINIRKGPGIKNEIVGKAYYGVVFKTLGKKSGWIEVEHESGLKGWIKETLLWGY